MTVIIVNTINLEESVTYIIMNTITIIVIIINYYCKNKNLGLVVNTIRFYNNCYYFEVNFLSLSSSTFSAILIYQLIKN